MKKIAKIKVDRKLCIGAASCIVAAMEVFELDDKNIAVMLLKNGVKKSGMTAKEKLEHSEIDDEILMMAAQSCPTRAILLYDEKGKRVYP